MVQQLWLLCLYCTTIVSGLPRGLLDVTQPPYSADNTGKHDVTSILQQAITDGYSKQLAVYFPVGKYLVSDTLTVLQSGWGAEQSDGGVNIVPCRFHSNTLIGSTEGACFHSNYTNLNHPPPPFFPASICLVTPPFFLATNTCVRPQTGRKRTASDNRAGTHVPRFQQRKHS